MPYNLHPISVPYRILQSAVGLVPMLFILAFVGSQAIGFIGPLFVLLLLGGIGAIVGWQIAYYRRFEYALTSDTFDIHSGVISRRNREIPYRRIQNVDISRSMVQRALGIAELRLETAGGTSSEAHLRYVGYEEAKRLQNALRDREHELDLADEDTDGEPAGNAIYEITTPELGVLAVASFDLRVASFLIVILTFLGAEAFALLFAIPIEPIVTIAAIGLFVILASAILSGGSAIINNYGFILSRIGDELRYERGLLQRYDGSIPIDKVQTLVLQENVLKRVLGYASLTVETAGYGPGQGAESSRAVPIAARSRTMDIASQIESSAMDLSFHRPSSRARVRYTVQYALIVVVLTLVAFGVDWQFGVLAEWWAVPALIILAPVAAHYKWKHRGYALADEAIMTRTGFWRRRTHIVPYYRIQTVDESQTVLQRRWHISTVIVDTAGSSGLVAGSPIAYDLDEQDATRLRQRLSAELQESLVVRKRRRRGARARFVQGVRGIW